MIQTFDHGFGHRPQRLQSSMLQYSTDHLRCSASSRPQRRRVCVIQNALTRKQKEQTVEKLQRAFENSTAVFGLRYKKISVKKFQEFRRSLPQEGAHLYVVKNNLIKIAADSIDGWSDLKQAAQGENAWVFANEDNVAACAKAFIDFEKKLKSELPRDKRAAAKPTDITGGVCDGVYLDYSKVIALEKMPTKQELIRDLAIMIKKGPTRVATSIKAIPTKLARAINLLSEGDENKDLLVGDVFPKAAAASE